MKLLYAEDERSLSEAVVDILTYHKYIVDAVYNGEDAYDYAVSGDYDGIILDIMMPKRDGIEVLSIICPSPLTWGSCWPVSVPCCAGGRSSARICCPLAI